MKTRSGWKRNADKAVCLLFGLVAASYVAGHLVGFAWADAGSMRDAVLFFLVAMLYLRSEDAKQAERPGDFEEEPQEV